MTSKNGTKKWKYPPISLLNDSSSKKADRGGKIHDNTKVIESTLKRFGIHAQTQEINLAPQVTQYALSVYSDAHRSNTIDLKDEKSSSDIISRIIDHIDDIGDALHCSKQLRMEVQIPGTNFIGIEVPNRTPEITSLKSVMLSDQMKDSNDKLTIPLGIDITDNQVITSMIALSHVLIGGSTGSGKSMLIHTWICTLLMHTTRQEVQFILIDPKRVELLAYNGIPHLLTPVIQEPDKAISALRWANKEMDKRYKLLMEAGVRNIDAFNDIPGFKPISHILIIIDEFSDLMAHDAAQTNDFVSKLVQMGKVAGIHIVISTSRPSEDVYPEVMRALFPTHIALNVARVDDSKRLIGIPGAEKLLGIGDMLVQFQNKAEVRRILGISISDGEIEKIVNYLRKNAPPLVTL